MLERRISVRAKSLKGTLMRVVIKSKRTSQFKHGYLYCRKSRKLKLIIININYMNQIIFLSVTFTAVSVFFATFVVTKLFFLVNRLGDSNFFIIDKLVWKSKIFRWFCPSRFMAAFRQFLIQVSTADWLSDFLLSKRRHWAPGAGSSIISLDF